jgi:diguanylate cyclase (GGDEF)-like protein
MANVEVDLEKIVKSDNLPSLPTAAIRLIEISNPHEVSLDELRDTIQSDPALAVRIVKAANSSYFGLRSEVNSIDHAIMILGPGALATMALSFSLACQSISDPKVAPFYRSYWLRSVVQGAAAETIMKSLERTSGGQAFLAGLLCDVGQLAMLKSIPRPYCELLEISADTGQPVTEVEREHFGFDHVEVGSRLLKRWGLPESIQHAAGHHHAHVDELASLTDPHAKISRITALAAGVGAFLAETESARTPDRMLNLSNELFNLSESDLNQLLENVHAQVVKTADLFELNTAEIPDACEIMRAANERLAEISVESQQTTLRSLAEKRALEEEKQKLEQEKSELSRMVVRDQLTDVHSRSFFETTLKKVIKQSMMSGAPIGLVFADIDHFKSINDKLGHQIGDVVLQKVARILKDTIRNKDVLARYGGEEFVAIIVGATQDIVRDVAERMRKAVESERIIIDGNHVPVSISVGACSLASVATETGISELLVKEADQAMYEAKRNGRNQTRYRTLDDNETPAGTAGLLDLNRNGRIIGFHGPSAV